jgi:hypothetical protein
VTISLTILPSDCTVSGIEMSVAGGAVLWVVVPQQSVATVLYAAGYAQVSSTISDIQQVFARG